MDQLENYLNMSIPEDAMWHVRTMLAVAIPDMSISKPYDLEFYEKANEYLHRNPCNNIMDGMVFIDLKTLVMNLISEFEEDIKGTKTAPEKKSETDEDISTYMAENFGIAY